MTSVTGSVVSIAYILKTPYDGGDQAHSEHPPRVGGIDDAVVPEPRGRVVRRTLVLVGAEDRRFEGLLVLGRPLLAPRLEPVATDRCEHRSRLLAAHHRDAGVGPHPQEARVVGATAHAVVAGAERAADDDGELRNDAARHGGHQLRAVLGDPAVLVLAADHEAGDVLQEHQWDAALVAQLDEVRALQRRLAEQDPVVGDDADLATPDAREGADQGLAVQLLELVEPAAVDDPPDHLAHVVRRARVAWHDVVQRLRCLMGLLDRLHR
jgi:hypothetical protein